jgi:hypothetical protein
VTELTVVIFVCSCSRFEYENSIQGRIQDFKLGGVHLKKLRRAEGGAKMFGVFRVKNHDFTPKNNIFSNFRGVRGRPPGAPPWIRPLAFNLVKIHLLFRIIPLIQ